MAINILVHPLFFIYSDLEKEKKNYWEQLQKLRNSNDRILTVNHPIPKIINSSLDEKLALMSERVTQNTPKEDLFYSKEPIFQNRVLTYGYIQNSDFTNFMNQLNTTEQIRIHGCYYGQCTSNIAVQISQYFSTKKDFIKGFEGNLTLSELQRIEYLENKLIMKQELSGALEKSNIRYGSVFKYNSDKCYSNKTILSKIPSIKSLNVQLTDSKTKIFG